MCCLYFFSMDGSTAIIEPGDRYQLIRTNHLEGGASDNPNPRPPGFVASPAVSGRALILRTRDYLYRIEHSPR